MIGKSWKGLHLATDIASAALLSVSADAVDARSERSGVVGAGRTAVSVGHASVAGRAGSLQALSRGSSHGALAAVVGGSAEEPASTTSVGAGGDGCETAASGRVLLSGGRTAESVHARLPCSALSTGGAAHLRELPMVADAGVGGGHLSVGGERKESEDNDSEHL
ncbi:hypothetical protein PMAYCL1PPCAC_25779, partial [Pristionchus mayeri]